MKITQSPTAYASAYRDALFRLSAAADELVELDVYDTSGSRIVGRRRFLGQTAYEANVAGYARSQIDVQPLHTVQCSFARPSGRIVRTTVRSGAVQATAVLGAGTRTLFEWDALSEAPGDVPIADNETDEIAVLPGGSALTAEAVLQGAVQRTVPLASSAATDDLLVFCLKMSDLKSRVESGKTDSLGRYRTLEIRIADGDETVLSRRYRLVPRRADCVRLAWWNRFGQVDYYTMRRPTDESYLVRKQRVLTAGGYAVTSSGRERRLSLVSDYQSTAAMRWLATLASAPRVWIANGAFPEADVLAERVAVSSEGLCRLELTLRDQSPETFQHL